MSNILSFIGGGVAGYLLEKVIDKGVIRAKVVRENYGLEKRLKNSSYRSEEELNIIKLANGYPSYDPKKQIFISENGKKLFISFPEEMVHLLESKESFQMMDESFDGSSSFDDIVIETGIGNLKELIDIHKRIVAHNFINMENGCHFNGKKYGVYEIDPNKRTEDIYESQELRIKLFQTDYFTHKVFRSIYKELKKLDHPISKVEEKDINRYRCFTTSFGLNGIVRVKSTQGNNSILLTKRSVHSTEMNGEERYSVSMIEGLTETDCDQNKQVNLILGFKRGLEEELGLTDKFYEDRDMKFYDIFLERNVFEIGITCSVTIQDQYTFEEDIQVLEGKDKILEVSSLFPQKVDKNSIVSFLNTYNMNTFSIYTLKSYLAREKVYI